MKITIEVNTNGIHDYASIEISEPRTDKLELIKDIMDTVELFNKNEIDKS